MLVFKGFTFFKYINLLVGVDITFNITYSPIMATILGVMLGLASSEFSNWRRDRKRRSRKKNSTRTLISLENERNMVLLKEFWYKLNDTEDNEAEKDEDKIDLSHRLIKMPLPAWNDVMWIKQAPLLAITFTDKEIIEISSFYNCLQGLKSIYTKLLDLDAKDREYNSTYAGNGVDLASLPRSKRFHEEAPGLWDEFGDIALKLIETDFLSNLKKC